MLIGIVFDVYAEVSSEDGSGVKPTFEMILCLQRNFLPWRRLRMAIGSRMEPTDMELLQFLEGADTATDGEPSIGLLLSSIDAQDLRDAFPSISAGWATRLVGYCAVDLTTDGSGEDDTADDTAASPVVASGDAPVSGALSLARVIQWHRDGLLDAAQFEAAKAQALGLAPGSQGGGLSK